MKFTKMQGLGNDYVYVNCFEETVERPEETARFVSSRNFGIDSDGLILIKPSEKADCQMDMYNLDGSQGTMCGNGIRCVGKYVYDHGIVDKTEIDVETLAGIRHLSLHVRDGKVETVTVDMGEPRLAPKDIPVSGPGEDFINRPLRVQGRVWNVTAVSMGNPHAVQVVADVDTAPVAADGPIIESHPRFPKRVNAGFMQVMDRHNVKLRVFERASGVSAPFNASSLMNAYA
mgnify:CR=1 FL=1